MKFSEIQSLIKIDTPFDFKQWKNEYVRLKNLIGPQLKLMKDDELISLHEKWSHTITSNQSEPVYELAVRILLANLHYYFFRIPNHACLTSNDIYYNDDETIKLRIILKSIVWICDLPSILHEYEYLFSRTLHHFNLLMNILILYSVDSNEKITNELDQNHEKNINHERNINYERNTNHERNQELFQMNELTAIRITYILKYAKEFIPDKINSFIKPNSKQFIHLALNMTGKLQNILIKSLLYYADFEGVVFYQTDISLRLFHSFQTFKVTRPSQIYVISLILSQISENAFHDLTKLINHIFRIFQSIDLSQEYEKSIDAFIELLIINKIQDFDYDSFFNFLLQHPSKQICKFIEFFYEDIKLINNRNIDVNHSNMALFNDFFLHNHSNICKNKVLLSILKNNPDFVCKFDKNDLKICKHFVECTKYQSLLLTDQIKNYIITQFLNHEANENILSLIIEHKHFFKDISSFSAYKNSRNDKIRELYLNSLDWISSVDEKNDKILSFMPTESNQYLSYQALCKIRVTPILSHNNLFYSFMFHSSFKIRKKMINLMPYCIVMNPLLAKPILSKLIDSVIYTLTFTSTLSSNNRNNIQYVRKMISLLVPISINYSTCKTCIYNIQNIDKTIPHHDIIVESILQLLIERYPITNNALSNFDMSSSVSNNSLSSSISTENGSELSHENSKNMPSISKHHMNSNISSNIDELEYFKRDEILLKIISILYKRFEYDIYTVLKIYLSIFENSLNESFIIYATNSLIEFCVKIKGGLNLSLIFPQIQKPLFKLFNTTQNIDLKASILHLFGCSFDSIDNYAPLIQNNAHSSLTYIDTLISLLLNKSYERHWIFYKIIASFFESDQEHYSDSYAQRVSQKIIHVLTVFRPPHQVELYQCLVIILEKCPYEAIPIMNDLIKMIKQNMHEKYCIKMLTIITQSVPIDYFELISSSYITVLELILISNKKYFRWAIRFITSAVVYFHLSIELYLNCLSNIEVNEDCLKFKIHEIKKSLIYVSKNVDISFYFTQFALMSSKFHFDPQLVLQKAAQYHKFEWILSRNNNQNDKIIIEDIDFQYKFYGKSFLDKFIPPDSYFNKKSFPIDLTNNSSEFTMRLIEFSYTNSPNTFFRNIAVIWRNFIKISLKTFPLVFLSIWKICSQEDKSYFSMLLNEILTLQHINSEIFRLIEYMDINGYKFEIDYWIVAQKTPSHHYSLIISQKFFVKSSFVPLFMYKTIFEASKKLDNRENFLPLFRVHKKNIDLDLRADGYYFLNEWGKALKLYQRVNSPLYKQISCLFRMRKYDEIIAMSDQISSLEEETDKQNSLTMLMWIYSIRRENFKILDLLSKVKMSKRGNILFPLILYYISTQEYSKAQECLENAFRGFRNIKFTKGDGFNNQLKLNDLHILSELDEIAGLKAGKKTLLSTNLPELWTNRIFHFERNDSTWEMLIQIRSFIKPIHSNLSAYLPIIKALRKNGHFEMIHHYFDPHFDYIFDIEVFIERLKIQWAEGLTKESFNGIETTCACVIIKDINQYVYIGTRWRVPFPTMTIYQCSLNPSFGTDIRDYVTEYFEAESFENSLLFLQKLSLKQQKDFFSHIILKFPECMYITFMNVMCNRKTFPHFFELAGKFAETIDTKLSYQYFNIARALKSNKTSSMKGWAIANLTLFLDSLNQSYFYQNSLKKDFNNRFVEIKNNQIEDHDQNDTNSNNLSYFPTYEDIFPLINESSDEQPDSNQIISIIEKMFNGEADKIGKNLIEKFTSNNFNPDINTKYNKTINERRKLVLESQPGNDPDIFAINLIESCLKIVKSDDNGAFEFLIQLFFVLFSMPHFEKLPKLYETDIINLPPKYLIQMIPQISKHLAKDATLQLIERLFCVISGYDFQSVFFSLNLYVKNDPNNLFSDQYFENDANIIIKESKNAHQILTKIIFDENKYSHANECKLIDEGFVKASQSVFEKWKFGLEKANERKEIRDKVLCCLFKEYHLLNSDLDQLFISNFNEPVQICEKLFHENTKESKNKMWTILHSLYNQLTKVVNQLNSIVLKKSSPELSKYKFHQMKIFGDYFENDYERENEKNNNSYFRNHLNSSTINEINLKQLETANNYNGNFLCSINDVLEIMGTQQRPRLLQLLSSNGKLYKFLLKSNEDLRLDQRVIQFFRLLNFFLKKYHDKRNLLEITCYTVVPLRVDCGLIRFVNNTESFSQIVNTIRTKQKTPINIESILNAEFSSEPYIKMNNLQKYEFFNYVFENQDAKELFDFLFHQSRNAIDFCRKVKNFTRSTALMSMVGHIIGLGDRHPSNILIDLINGLVVHIDFGDSFEKAQHRKEFPEKVPFRLTKMFLNSIEAGKGGGTFASSCVEVIKLIRKKKISLSAQLTVFLKELEDDKSKIEKVTQKINGCEFGYQMTPEEQVHKLINIAIDPMNYIQHYQGWCPFW